MTVIRAIKLRARLLSGFGLVCLLLVGITALGIQGSAQQAALTARVGELQVLTRNVMQLKYRSADISSWQVSYTWDVTMIGGTAATSDVSPNRRGFEDSVLGLERELRILSRAQLTTAQESLFNESKKQFDIFLKTDAQAVALYQKETATATGQANQLILGVGFDAYSKIQKSINKLATSVKRLADQARLQAQAKADQLALMLSVGCALALLLAIAISSLITRSIVGPARRVVDGLRTLATRDLSVTLPINGKDELAAMSLAFNQAATEMRVALTGVAERTTGITLAADQLLDLSEVMDTQVSTVSNEATVVTDSAGEISVNIEGIASSTEEMTASISEISRSSRAAASVAETAVSVARTTASRMGELDD